MLTFVLKRGGQLLRLLRQLAQILLQLVALLPERAQLFRRLRPCQLLTRRFRLLPVAFRLALIFGGLFRFLGEPLLLTEPLLLLLSKR
ncbi:hypothetical protein HA44_22075 [Mixta gaviniae]|nr:hypothetical protein HA44_22075 [Mixta gaviniae]